MTEFAVDPMRNVNIVSFRNEVYEGYHSWMVQDDIEYEDGIAEEWNCAVSNEMEEALLGISEEQEREGTADTADVLGQTELRVQEEVARLEVVQEPAGDGTSWDSRMVWNCKHGN